ncbi:MAG: LysR family transcriptional regulator [Clostridiales bacterium]|nr:LysR family transcriptional regulator [Candidatus Cacconaster stercorequi]
MDTKKLRALATAVQLGSFTRAAEVLGYTQSGLTHMMNSLEKDVGFPVLVRCRSGVKLTPAGERIFPLVQEFLASGEALEREIMLVNTDKEETIRVSAYSSIAMHWLPEVIERFRYEHPKVNVDIQMGSVEEVYRWVREDKVDMCFASRQENMNVGMEWTHLRDDPLLAVLPQNYPLAGETTFDVRRFDGQEFLMPSMGFDLDIMRALNRSDVSPQIRTTQVSDSVVISMVGHGLGVTILSELVLKGRQDDVKTLPLSPAAVRELGIVSQPRKELRPLARRFIAAAQEIIATL